MHPNFRSIALAVVELDITNQSSFADGETFGDVGSYEPPTMVEVAAHDLSLFLKPS